MKRLMLVIPLLVSVGCVAGNRFKFDYKPATMPNVGSGTAVVVAAAEGRPDVVSGDEPKSFVGEQRNGYGMPFNITTEGDVPFASVVAESVRRDLEASGFRAVAANNPDELSRAIRSNNANRGLLVTIKEFKTDTMNNITVNWNLEAAVVDGDGKVLATNSVSGESDIKGSMMNPVKASKQKVPAFLFDELHKLVSDARIVSALTR